MVAARPGTRGSDAWVRSRAWMEDFSSMHSTIALSGGSRYKPTTSISFSLNRGSLLILNVSTRCGFKPSSDQTRCTVAGLTPTRAAIVRTNQCVAPCGVVLVVSSTISAIVSSLIDGLRPRPFLDLPPAGEPVGVERSPPGPDSGDADR